MKSSENSAPVAEAATSYQRGWDDSVYKGVDLSAASNVRDAGAIVLSYLAYPEPKAAEIRQETALRSQARVFGVDGLGIWVTAEGGAPMPVDLKRLERGRSRLEHRLRMRLSAGAIALEPLLAYERSEPPKHVRGGRWNQAAALREAAKVFGINEKTLATKVWRPSRPVMHLAASWVGMLSRDDQHGHPVMDVPAFMTDAGWLSELLSRAAKAEEAIVSSIPTATADSLIYFRNWEGFSKPKPT